MNAKCDLPLVRMNFRTLAALLFALSVSLPANAAKCGGDFNLFLNAMSRDAQAAGVSRAVIDQAFAGVTPDQAVLPSIAARPAPSAARATSKPSSRRASPRRASIAPPS